MSLNLITGYSGTPHITAEDHGGLNSCIFGTSEVILKVGRQFEAVDMGSNTIRVYDGELMMQGRHMRINSGTYEDVTIESGEQGTMRHDLIVARYKKDTATGIESASLVVLKGTPSGDSAADPAYTAGDILSESCTLSDMPLYRVTLDGVTIQSIERVARTARPVNDLMTLGVDPIESTSADTPEVWSELGSGMAHISQSGLLLNQPYESGVLHSEVTATGMVVHTFTALNKKSTTYKRSGVGSTWYNSGKWYKQYSEAEVIPVEGGGTGATTVPGVRKNLGLGETSGALPIANGGTGATTKSGARANLEAMGTSGTQELKDGTFRILDEKGNSVGFIVRRPYGSGYRLCSMSMNSDGEAIIRLREDDGTWNEMKLVNVFTLGAEKSELKKPLTVASGGTGESSRRTTVGATFSSANVIPAESTVSCYYFPYLRMNYIRVDAVLKSAVEEGDVFEVLALDSGNAPAYLHALSSAGRYNTSATVNTNGNINVRAHENIPANANIYITGVWIPAID